MEKRSTFNNLWLPYLLVAPQIIITFIFFIWPASQALYRSFLIEDAFGLSSEFIWFENFEELFRDPLYLESFKTTVIFSVSTTFLSLSLSLMFAVMADRVIKGEMAYKSILLWPYAVAPAVAGVLWMFMFNPGNGILALTLQSLGYEWNHVLRGGQAMVLVIIAAAWKQISYNFIFFLAGLQSIPKSMLEASAIDGAGPVKRFWTIVFPLISPTTFFLIVVNVVYAFFETFGIIHAVTQGGPYKSTEILVYKVYNDGFVGLDLGGSSAQSVILMIIVISLTVFQFRYIERRVQY
ncbi:MAG TPA: sn-glycerol-3-phosphate ABC transporter permease UgpA [Candidatus Marinimicrobia bacterium]|mgnify:FL=1|jgi:sn-glycerol 3-phosphate transport system permease protein|nr:sn-glycerol-3-phosphate ABC transporter permease UgpA [SAR324 cluster bacterium]HCV45459.1 sn-glycerol-3-phosphate ABC transporter permease UgpA [Deltaproteobacteria bacterium]HJL78814.1 sn-glycerol-3-phosphate ABC transporter permease UgpA [Candidatus Neomarinimicrobiota bacterium]MDP6432289.1 sn-glycerol-3-phosphate ABC transporter permease UgpA [SAR324 cluster bacterium]MDP7499824.1 sn-glycerol-3-phosphate ABC transporter permease UgpA [SAR324 cluster bacterium]|tara:strand:+ start:1485 stop:2366 length:882 start_codon:yes stop_codon:yes gene_type:complete